MFRAIVDFRGVLSIQFYAGIRFIRGAWIFTNSELRCEFVNAPYRSKRICDSLFQTDNSQSMRSKLLGHQSTWVPNRFHHAKKRWKRERKIDSHNKNILRKGRYRFQSPYKAGCSYLQMRRSRLPLRNGIRLSHPRRTNRRPTPVASPLKPRRSSRRGSFGAVWNRGEVLPTKSKCVESLWAWGGRWWVGSKNKRRAESGRKRWAPPGFGCLATT